MKKRFKLNRTKQCKHCPWKKSTNPFEIPNGYDVDKHIALVNTIAKEGVYDPTNNNLRVMACHCSSKGKEEYCIGWLHHQLGSGNNILLRLTMMSCENAIDISVVGEQHQCFEDTLPF
ncbi:MAG: hypothetical protein AAF806_26420 [Bacteroidota bacterium]